MIAGRYQILDQLGQGSQGLTFKVHDTHQNEVVALKLLNGNVNYGPWHEAVALTRLRDDHILPVRNADFLMPPGIPYLVTEYEPHGTVQGKINATGTAGIDPVRAVRWIRQACQGVTRTHDAHLLHTDIKPENLFLDGNRNVRLGDFGLACLIQPLGLGVTAGTAQTVAPEVAQAMTSGIALSTSVMSDVYSLGASLYWMLTAQSPGPADFATAVAHRPANLRDLAPHVSLALASRVNKAMARDPVARYPSAGDFAAALGRIPAAARRWIRTNEHANHAGCWRGTKEKHATVLVCAAPVGKKMAITAIKLPGQQRIHAVSNSPVTNGQLPAALRRAFDICS